MMLMTHTVGLSAVIISWTLRTQVTMKCSVSPQTQ